MLTAIIYQMLGETHNPIPNSNTKIVLRDLNAKTGQEEIYPRRNGKPNLHQFLKIYYK